MRVIDTPGVPTSSGHMSYMNQSFDTAPRVNQSAAPQAIGRAPCARDVCVLHLKGAFRAPLTGELRHKVQTLLRRGSRTIVLDLTSVPSIDAAGISQLVLLYNVTAAANGVLRIVHAGARVRELLQRVALFELLDAERG
jgi:anti-anti-sigma factor